ncbi:hypothetical protein niasHT_028218 [Heterodera trifolii]|uniref:Uncharacterized protein n=1 Tax=Heterodera trifolii TaxID=157864 RepID=A0ABD2K8Q4_9BILA
MESKSTDPNYGTLKNLDADIFTKNAPPSKPAAAQKEGPPQPQTGGGGPPTTDPNYGTLKNLDADIFTKNASPSKPAAAPKAGPAPHGGGGQALTPSEKNGENFQILIAFSHFSD